MREWSGWWNGESGFDQPVRFIKKVINLAVDFDMQCQRQIYWPCVGEIDVLFNWLLALWPDFPRVGHEIRLRVVSRRVLNGRSCTTLHMHVWLEPRLWHFDYAFVHSLTESLTFVPFGQSLDLEMRTPAGSDVFDPGCSKSWGEASWHLDASGYTIPQEVHIG